MRNRALYILSCVILCFCSACFEKEYFEPVQKENDAPIRFSATPKGFVQANVGTRAGETEGFDPTTFENTIYNAFFLMFDHNGTLRIKEKAEVVDSSSVTYNLGRDMLNIFDRFTICFLANIPETVLTNDFTVGTTTWTDMQNYYLTMTYAPFSETGTVGVPAKTDLNGDTVPEYALPMFGSKEVTAPYSQTQGYYSFQLERLFARVEVMMSLGIQPDNSIFTSAPQFSLFSCDILNIPTKAPLLKKDRVATYYAENRGDDNYTDAEISSYSNKEYIISYSPLNNPEYNSLFFYVPEHKLNLSSTNEDQKLKPDLLEGKDLRAICASISGYLVGSDGTSYEVLYKIYLGENAYNSFDLSRNTKYINKVHINGITQSDIDHRVEIEEIQNMVEGLDKEGKTSNCYIIEGNGTYMLPAYKGAYELPDINAKMCEEGTNAVLICDNSKIQIEIDHRRSKQSTIVFTVSGITSGTGIDVTPETGHAVIARYDKNGNIDWSWHLWFVGNNEFSLGGDLDLGESWTSNIVKDQSLPDGSSIMDRNLGTYSNVWTNYTGIDLGLYYRYGRKEPYFSGAYQGGGTLDGNPTWETQNNKKSPTDPCPAGYRVPPASLWEGTNAQNATNAHFSGTIRRQVGFLQTQNTQVSAFRYWNNGNNLNNGDDIYYPYGYQKDNSLCDAVTINNSVREAGSSYRYESQLSQDTDMGWSETITTTVYAEYTNVRYSVNYEALIGALLNQNGITPFITYKNITHLQLLSYDYQERTEIRRQTWFNPGGTTTTTYGPKTTIYNNQVNEIVTQLTNALAGSGELGDLRDGDAISYVPAYGYQVRCVKE